MAHAGYTVAVTKNQYAYIVEALARFQIEKMKIVSFTAFVKVLLTEFPWRDRSKLENVMGDDYLFENARHSDIRIAIRLDDKVSQNLRDAREIYADVFNRRISISATVLILVLTYLRTPELAE